MPIPIRGTVADGMPVQGFPRYYWRAVRGVPGLFIAMGPNGCLPRQRGPGDLGAVSTIRRDSILTETQLESKARTLHNAILALEHAASARRAELPARLRTRLAAFTNEWREWLRGGVTHEGASESSRATSTAILADFIREFNGLEREVLAFLEAPAPGPGPGPSPGPAPEEGGGAVETAKSIAPWLLLGLGVAGAVYFATRDRDELGPSTIYGLSRTLSRTLTR